MAVATCAQLPTSPAPGQAGAVRSSSLQTLPVKRDYAWWVSSNQNRLQYLARQGQHISRPGAGYRNKISYEDFQRQLLLKYPVLQKSNNNVVGNTDGRQRLPVQRSYAFYQQLAANKKAAAQAESAAQKKQQL